MDRIRRSIKINVLLFTCTQATFIDNKRKIVGGWRFETARQRLVDSDVATGAESRRVIAPCCLLKNEQRRDLTTWHLPFWVIYKNK